MTMSRRSESLTGGGVGSGLDRSSLNFTKGEMVGSGLKYAEGEDGGKYGSIGVVNVEEDCDGVYNNENSDGDTVAVLAVLERNDRKVPLAKERVPSVIVTVRI